VPARCEHGPERAGDVRHSQADIAKARMRLGYAPSHDVAAGLAAALPWYVERFGCVSV
jgi:UDP-N-acetylglucosamine 4-epimerase